MTCRMLQQAVISLQKPSESLPELVLDVFGAYPENRFHLFPVLMKDSRLLLPLSTKLFPVASFKPFMDVLLTKNSSKFGSSSTLAFPEDTPTLYTQFLSFCPTPTSPDTLEVNAFEYYVLRFLRCLADLQLSALPSQSREHKSLPSSSDSYTTGILAFQLFLHLLHFLLPVDAPPPTPIPEGFAPSLARPGAFLLHSLAELWLRRDATSPREWPELLRNASLVSAEVRASRAFHPGSAVRVLNDAELPARPPAPPGEERESSNRRRVYPAGGAGPSPLRLLRAQLRRVPPRGERSECLRAAGGGEGGAGRRA